MEITKVNPQEFGLEVSQAETIEQAFAPKIIERDGYAIIYSELITKEIDQQVCKDASDLRKKLVKVRTGIAEIHKTQKAFFLAAGRFVDAWKNKETLPIEQMEENLQGIENYYINIEKEKAAALKAERIAILSEFSDTPELFQVELMTDVAFNQLLEGQKLAKQARIAAEKKAEDDRLAAIEAERVENERIRIENAKLQAEAEAKERQIEKERKEAADKLKAEQDASEAARLKAEAEAEAVLKAEREKADKERKEAEEKAAKERAESERKLKEASDAAKKIADELAAKQQAEAKAKEAEEIAAKKAANAPIKTKVTVWIDSLEMPDCGDSATVSDIRTKLEGFKTWARTQLTNL